MKKQSFKELGIEFKNTKSERVFKKLYINLQKGVLNYYSRFPNIDVDSIDSAFTKSMIAIWRDIDKLNVVDYSISTLVYLKVKQELIYVKKHKKEISESELSSDSDNNVLNFYNDEVIDSQETVIIKNDNINQFWLKAKKEINDDLAYNLIKSWSEHGYTYKELSNMYNITFYDVNNLIAKARKKIVMMDKSIKKLLLN